MDKETIITKVNAFLVDEFEIEENILSPDALLKKDLGIDSLDIVDVIVLIDKEFGIKVTRPAQDSGRSLLFHRRASGGLRRCQGKAGSGRALRTAHHGCTAPLSY